MTFIETETTLLLVCSSCLLIMMQTLFTEPGRHLNFPFQRHFFPGSVVLLAELASSPSSRPRRHQSSMFPCIEENHRFETPLLSVINKPSVQRVNPAENSSSVTANYFRSTKQPLPSGTERRAFRNLTKNSRHRNITRHIVVPGGSGQRLACCDRSIGAVCDEDSFPGKFPHHKMQEN